MKLSKISKAVAAAALVVAGGVGTANAATFNFYYGMDVVATMTTSGNTTFNLSFVYAPAVAGTAFINDVMMLNTGGATLANSVFTNLGPEQGTASYSANGFEGNPWNWKISFPTSNGQGANRFQEGESTSWSIVSTDINAWDFGQLHINAFLNGQSIKLGGCDSTDPNCGPTRNEIPEPGALALVGLALLAGGLARRKVAQAA